MRKIKKQKKKLPNDPDINPKCNASCKRLKNTKIFKFFVVRELRKQNKGRTPKKIKAFILRKIIKPKKSGTPEKAEVHKKI